MKKCIRCGKDKPNDDFHKSINHKDGLWPYCRTCTREKKQERRYGNSTDYNKLFIKQEGKCAICGIHQNDIKGKFHLDHDHETGVIRGLLCKHCNWGLGSFYDNPDLLNSAINYLKITKS